MDATTKSLSATESIVQFHLGFARALDQRLEHIVHRDITVPLYPHPDIITLSDDIALSVSSLTSSLRETTKYTGDLVTTIESLKLRVDRREHRHAFWRWVGKFLTTIAKALNEGGKLASAFGPHGQVAGAVMSAVSTISKGLAQLCERTKSEDLFHSFTR